MAVYEYLCSISPLPLSEEEKKTLMYKHHLTATSVTLLGQGPGVLWPIFMLLLVWTTIQQDPEAMSVVLPIIVTME